MKMDILAIVVKFIDLEIGECRVTIGRESLGRHN